MACLRALLALSLMAAASAACCNMFMTNRRMINFVNATDGFHATTYLDAMGNRRVCYGHQQTISEPTYTALSPLSESYCSSLLTLDIANAVSCVQSYVNVELNSNQFGALVDLVYTGSCTTLSANTSLLQAINALSPSVPSLISSLPNVASSRRFLQANMWSAIDIGKVALVSADVYNYYGRFETAYAAASGFTVYTTTPAKWALMTAQDFAKYNLLIIADVNGQLPAQYMNSASVWAPVVMGRSVRKAAGNRVVFGTDPAGHVRDIYNERGTAWSTGFVFAAAVPDTTGLFFVASEVSSSILASVLTTFNLLSDGKGNWTGNVSPPCGGNVALVASHPSFTPLTTASLLGWDCSVHVSFPQFPSDWIALGVATDTASHPTCGTDPHTGNYSCGEAYLLVAGQAIEQKSQYIALPTSTGTSTVTTGNTFTLNVVLTDPSLSRRRSTKPLVNQSVTFTVTGLNRGTTGTCNPANCRTAVDGSISYTYANNANATGADTIGITFVDSRGSRQSATFQVQWAGSTQDTSSGSTGVAPATIGGIVAGAIVLIALVAAAAVFATRRRPAGTAPSQQPPPKGLETRQAKMSQGFMSLPQQQAVQESSADNLDENAVESTVPNPGYDFASGTSAYPQAGMAPYYSTASYGAPAGQYYSSATPGSYGTTAGQYYSSATPGYGNQHYYSQGAASGSQPAYALASPTGY